jgi:hypothetical protein
MRLPPAAQMISPPEFVENGFVSLASGSGDQPQIYRSRQNLFEMV